MSINLNSLKNVTKSNLTDTEKAARKAVRAERISKMGEAIGRGLDNLAEAAEAQRKVQAVSDRLGYLNREQILANYSLSNDFFTTVVYGTAQLPAFDLISAEGTPLWSIETIKTWAEENSHRIASSYRTI